MGSVRFNNQTIRQGLFEVSATAQHPLGSQIYLDDGRAYRYGLNGAVAALAGNLYAGPANIADHQANNALDAPGAGTDLVTITLDATAVTEDQYAEGYLIMDATTANGGGATYKIKGHPAANASASCAIRLYDPLWEAVPAAATASLKLHPGAGVLITAAPNVQTLYGVAARDIPIANYGWFQFRGICGVLTSGTLVLGEQVIAGGAAGAVTPVTTTYDEPYCPIGRCALVSATTQYSIIDLNII